MFVEVRVSLSRIPLENHIEFSAYLALRQEYLNTHMDHATKATFLFCPTSEQVLTQAFR